MPSGYSVTAQYYDAVAADQHAPIDARIGAALAGLDTRAGPVVDIGAGTGLTTLVIAAALPDAEIFAVEPDPAMRPALMTRIWSDPDLRRRVSILPFDILETPFAPIAGAVLSASLVHFSPADRARLWTLLASRLSPTGRIIVEVQCPEAVDFPDTAMATAQVGRLVYEARAAARKLDAERQCWSMTYRTLLDGREIACDQTEYICWAVSAEQLASEGARAGLANRTGGTLVVLTHAAKT